MSVDLDDFTAALRREVTPLGSNLFGSITDSQLLPYLQDAFWEAKLDGFFPGYVEVDGVISPDETGAEDLDRKYIALIVLYAGIKMLRNRILNMNTGFRAKAGPVEFEQQNSATMLAEMLRQLRDTKDRILEEFDEWTATDTMVLDALSVRTFSSGSYWGSIELTG